MIHPLVEHLAARMQPRDLASVARRDSDLMHLLPAPQALGHALAQRVEPFTGDRRDRDDIFAAAGFLKQPLPLFAREQVDLVPGLDAWRRALFRQAKRFEHVLDIIAL